MHRASALRGPFLNGEARSRVYRRLLRIQLVWLGVGVVGIFLILGATLASFAGLLVIFLSCGIPDAGCPLDEPVWFGWLVLGIGLTASGAVGYLVARRAQRRAEPS